MAASLLGMAVSVIDGSIVNLALPDITRDFGASPSAAVWVVTAYQLATLALLLPFASLGERLGYRRVYLWGLALFTVSSLGCSVAADVPMLAAARAVQGIGAAGMMAVNSALVRLIYPAGLLGRGIALSSVVVATSSVAGPTVAAAVLSVASWQWLFAVNLPLGLAVLWLGRRSLPHSPPHAAGPLRLADAALNVLMFSLVFLGADAIGARDAQRAAVPATTGIALVAAGIAVGICHVRRQRHQARPLFPVDLLRIPVFALSMCTSIAAFAAQTLAFVALPFLLLDSQGRSHVQAGLVMTVWPLATVCLAPVAGRLIARHPGGLLGGIGLGSMTLGLVALAVLPAHATALDSGVAPGAVRRRVRAVPVAEQPHHHHQRAPEPLRRGQRHAGLGTADGPVGRRGHGGHDLRRGRRARRPRPRHRARGGGRAVGMRGRLQRAAHPPCIRAAGVTGDGGVARTLDAYA